MKKSNKITVNSVTRSKRPKIREGLRNKIKKNFIKFLLFTGSFLCKISAVTRADDDDKVLRADEKYHSIPRILFDATHNCEAEFAAHMEHMNKPYGTPAPGDPGGGGEPGSFTRDGFGGLEGMGMGKDYKSKIEAYNDGNYCYEPASHYHIFDMDKAALGHKFPIRCLCGNTQTDVGTRQEFFLDLSNIVFNLAKRYDNNKEKLDKYKSLIVYKIQKFNNEIVSPGLNYLTVFDLKKCVENIQKYPQLTPLIAIALWELNQARKCLSLYRKHYNNPEVPFVLKHFVLPGLGLSNLFMANVNLEAACYFSSTDFSRSFIIDAIFRTGLSELILEYITRNTINALENKVNPKSNKSTLNNDNNPKGGMKRLDRFVTTRYSDSTIQVSDINKISKLIADYDATKYIADYVKDVKDKPVFDKPNKRSK
uniref:Uncharacterized protein n=1 Tax=Nitzschia sp. NIES-3576 TaxID=2083273 RepID=A0A2Z5ZAL8_9STRA|nr:hypothetical protein [Nitzschia sp. NIES-3576]BBC77661.1 hypothetical protein [Nitzschia sp. NIES-3576]